MNRYVAGIIVCAFLAAGCNAKKQETAVPVQEAVNESAAVIQEMSSAVESLPPTAVVEAVKATVEAPVSGSELIVYTDKGFRDNHYVPSGWMGDTGDIKMNDQAVTSPHAGTTCIEFVYSAKKTQGNGWAGVYWLNPVNNWGSQKGGINLSAMNKLTFWARGAKGGEVIQKIMVGGIKGTYSDTVAAEIGPVILTSDWKQYTINLTGKDLTYVSGGFGWTTNADVNPDGITFYIDDVKFEKDSTLKAEGRKQEDMPFYVYADRSNATNHFIPAGWMGDYQDLKLETGSKEAPYKGDTCIKIIYSGKAAQGNRWAGMFWQNPANNWGNTDGGFDISKATKLTFWAKGLNGGERIEEFKIGGLMGEFSDSDSVSIGPIILEKEWKQYTIDLKGKDLSYIIGGFAWSANVDNNPQGATFYLDEIKFE